MINLDGVCFWGTVPNGLLFLLGGILRYFLNADLFIMCLFLRYLVE